MTRPKKSGLKLHAMFIKNILGIENDLLVVTVGASEIAFCEVNRACYHTIPVQQGCPNESDDLHVRAMVESRLIGN